MLRDGAVGGDDGVESLGFAAGGNGCAPDNGGVEMREGFAVERAKVKDDVQMREGGFLEGERGGTGEMVVGEVEKIEDAERLDGAVVTRARDDGGGEKVVRGEVEVYLGVGARGACRGRRRERRCGGRGCGRWRFGRRRAGLRCS